MIYPIVFVHGFGGGLYEYRPIITFLRSHGYSKFHLFTYRQKFGQVSLREIAKDLADFVRREVKSDRIIIMGISQGGIIAEYYMKQYCKKRIQKLITLCTPHKGSIMAYLLNLPGVVDLRPRSKLLNELEAYSRKIKVSAVYTPFDLIVVPGWNAIPNKGNVKKVYAPLHPLAFWWPSTLNFILREIENS